MKKRSLSEAFLADFKENGKFAKVTELAVCDPTLDFEMRGDSVMLYYRGGKILEIKETGGIDGLDTNYSKGICLTPNMDELDTYIYKAKSLIDKFQLDVKNHLGEKEYQQRIVYENNQSVNAEDNDFFIADVEWADSTLDGRADIVAFRWDHMRHAKREVQMVIIEVKQGENSIKTRSNTADASLKKHYDDYLRFKVQTEYVKDVAKDMLIILHQKYLLGLVKGLENLFVNDELPTIEDGIDFICLLANYKPYSRLLYDELSAMDDDKYKDCKFFVASFMGYCLYKDFILTKDELKKKYPQVKGFNKE